MDTVIYVIAELEVRLEEHEYEEAEALEKRG